ncbi:hypothetical protein A7A09_007260 [Paracoccus methylarcula]|uniref:Uncharacterized protein n=1 Tax=Paracoccus methylarcula TaxID=72022 RepID=A0A3R7SDB0_9RHOB|nr:hypothetical protein A7A09_007260 [Paracoccus methylarcula]
MRHLWDRGILLAKVHLKNCPLLGIKYSLETILAKTIVYMNKPIISLQFFVALLSTVRNRPRSLYVMAKYMKQLQIPIFMFVSQRV